MGVNATRIPGDPAVVFQRLADLAPTPPHHKGSFPAFPPVNEVSATTQKEAARG